MKSIERHIDIPSESQKRLTGKATKYSQKIARIVTKHDYKKHESALAIVSDLEYQGNLAKDIEHLRGAKHVILIGIGGSSLGTEAVFSALAFDTHPSLHVLDGIDEEALRALGELIAGIETMDELSVVVVSKSGTTTETMTNAVAALELLEAKFGKNVNERVAFVGTKGTDFLEIGDTKKVTCVSFPESIGGRYSVFTAVGIVPLMLLNVDVQSLLDGAVLATSKAERTKTVEHAVSLAALAFEGVHTVNFFTFNQRLRLLGFWYRQLLAESIGKRMTTEGATFCHQLLPTVASDVDLHSMVQLYLGGYRGMYTHFVYGDVESEHHKLTDHWLLSHVKMLEGHAPKEIRDAIRVGVFKAYDDQKLPYRFTMLPKITAHEIGYLMASLMFEVMLLGELFDVDVFDQPNVESYKSYTREVLMQ